MYKKRVLKGFTLIETLLAIVAISILASIVLVAINPNKQISQTRDAARRSDTNSIRQAIEQYSIDNGGQYPNSIPIGNYKEICIDTINANCVDLSILVPNYIARIPIDPTGVAYKVGVNSNNNRLSVLADKSELSSVGINIFTSTNNNNNNNNNIVLAAGDRDPSLNTGIPVGFNNNVNSLVLQSNGKIILGGGFTTYQGVSANRIIRLNSDGSLDNSFNLGTGFNNGVNSLVLQSDGKIIVGGVFTSYQGVSANYIIRLNSDGSLDTSFNLGTGFDNTVNSLVLQSDSKIIVGGAFTTYQGVSANRIIRLNSDGSLDNSFNLGTGFNNGVNSLVLQSDGKIIVGGAFTTYQGVSANRIIRLNSDGSRDNSFNMGTGFSASVLSLALQSDGKIIVGGNFTSYQGVSVNKIIRLNSDGSRDTSFNTAFSSTPTYPVNSIALQSDGKIIVGGNFSAYQGVSANYIIRLNSDGSRDTSFNMGTGFGFSGPFITNGLVNSLVLQSDGKIIVGGSFINYQEVGANRIIRLNSDGSLDNSFNLGTGFNNTINSLALQSDGKIIVGGNFTSYQGVSANYIIRLNSDGSRDNSFNLGTGFNSGGVIQYVTSLALQSDGKIIVGGGFTSYQGVSANKIIRLNSDGSRDTSFNIGTGFNNTVSSLALQSDGKIIVGGRSFTSYQGVSANYIIRLNSDGSRDTSFNLGTGFNSIVNSLVLQSDGKIIVGGDFSTYQGVSANRIIRLNSDGSRDTSFNLGTGFNSAVNSLVLQSDGKILVGGGFTSYQGVSANRIIRLNSDGSLDNSFNLGTGFDNAVNSLALQSDGKILVGGSFTSYQGVIANRIIRLNSDGSLDNSFNLGTGFDNTVNSLVLQSDGKIIVGGGFTRYSEQPAGYLIRIAN